eukprot:scaffold2214_cov139-Cylindrotheca_fusiformis.AAC.7
MDVVRVSIVKGFLEHKMVHTKLCWRGTKDVFYIAKSSALPFQKGANSRLSITHELPRRFIFIYCPYFCPNLGRGLFSTGGGVAWRRQGSQRVADGFSSK